MSRGDTPTTALDGGEPGTRMDIHTVDADADRSAAAVAYIALWRDAGNTVEPDGEVFRIHREGGVILPDMAAVEALFRRFPDRGAFTAAVVAELDRELPAA